MSFNSLAELRNNRGNFDTLIKEVEKIANPQASADSRDDDRYWSPEVDKAGNGYAVIRFLPAPKGEEMPWSRVYNHGFKGPTGKWYIENSLTTLGKPDPVSELNSQLWETGTEANQNLVRQQKRRTYYTCNVLIVEDLARPENKGKVKLFRFGKKIFEKIKDVMQPQFPGEEPVNPFDFWRGANFKLKIRQVEGYRNYDKSEFDSISPLSNDDAEIERIWSQEHSIAELTDAKHFKSYDELKKKLNDVLSGSSPVTRTAESTDIEDSFVTKSQAAPAPSAPSEPDDSMSYFANLASDD